MKYSKALYIILMDEMDCRFVHKTRKMIGEMNMETIVTVQNFEEEVEKSDLPVMIDFYADWCGPCKAMAPLVEKLAEEYQGKVKICKCNSDENMELTQKFKIRGIPNFIFYKNGEKVDSVVGMTDANGLKEKLNLLLS